MNTYDYLAATHDRAGADLVSAFTSGKPSVFSYITTLHAADCRDESVLARAVHRDTFHIRPNAENSYARRLRDELQRAYKDMTALGLIGVAPDAIARFPNGCAILEFDFTLEKKFISRDDSVFYPIDNPVRKDRVFKLPMTSGSSWKGNLRAAAVENLLDTSHAEQRIQQRLDLVDIFGDEKGAEEAPERKKKKDWPLALYLTEVAKIPVCPLGRKARLRCLPTFYDRVDLDILNPRNRVTRAGTVPIVMETIPAGARGRFSAIYCPFDLMGQSEEILPSAATRDWALIGAALHRMFRVSGFGAKKSSGCGKASAAISAFRFDCNFFRPFRLASLDELKSLHTHLEAAA